MVLKAKTTTLAILKATKKPIGQDLVLKPRKMAPKKVIVVNPLQEAVVTSRGEKRAIVLPQRFRI